MRWRTISYDVAINRNLVVDQAAALSQAEADEADESGFLAGNQMYQDLRGCGWDELARAIAVEREFIFRLQQAEDLEAEAARIDDERQDCFDPAEGLWELDIGVASATIALSALGAIPVGSCNAGGFGGHHQASRPYVAFYLAATDPELLTSIARDANVGLSNAAEGLVQIFAAGDLDLVCFAEVALARCAPSPPLPDATPD